MGDRTRKYFFIAQNYDKIAEERLKSFLKLVTSNEPSDDFASRVSKLVEDAIAFLKEKIPPETIAKCIKLPLERVLELKEQIYANSF